MKVRANSIYKFDPCFIDQVMPQHYTAQKGDIVRVINLPGCPKANTMGMCHIESLDGKFLGMVSTNSLNK